MITRQATIDIDEENNLAYIYLQPERKDERGSVRNTSEYLMFEPDSSVIKKDWPEINVDHDDDDKVFGIELIGFKI